jgi:hypothetical protein
VRYKPDANSLTISLVLGGRQRNLDRCELLTARLSLLLLLPVSAGVLIAADAAVRPRCLLVLSTGW